MNEHDRNVEPLTAENREWLGKVGISTVTKDELRKMAAILAAYELKVRRQVGRELLKIYDEYNTYDGFDLDIREVCHLGDGDAS